MEGRGQRTKSVNSNGVHMACLLNKGGVGYDRLSDWRASADEVTRTHPSPL